MDLAQRDILKALTGNAHANKDEYGDAKADFYEKTFFITWHANPAKLTDTKKKMMIFGIRKAFVKHRNNITGKSHSLRERVCLTQSLEKWYKKDTYQPEMDFEIAHRNDSNDSQTYSDILLPTTTAGYPIYEDSLQHGRVMQNGKRRRSRSCSVYADRKLEEAEKEHESTADEKSQVLNKDVEIVQDEKKEAEIKKDENISTKISTPREGEAEKDPESTADEKCQVLNKEVEIAQDEKKEVEIEKDENISTKISTPKRGRCRD